MSLKIKAGLLAGMALLGASGLGGCGKFGALEQPAPLFGEHAREDYDAKRAARDAQSNENRTNAPVAAADRPDPNADDAPRTTRDMKDPAQLNLPVDKDPIQGVPDINGPRPSMQPPG